jgi:hypothetical protein
MNAKLQSASQQQEVAMIKKIGDYVFATQREKILD